MKRGMPPTHPAHWRKRGAEMRALAGEVHDETIRFKLLDVVAEGYDLLAQWAEERLQRTPASDKAAAANGSRPRRRGRPRKDAAAPPAPAAARDPGGDKSP